MWELEEVSDIEISPIAPIYGIDVSAWQGDVDWKLVKESGVEFSIIRSGTTLSSDPDKYYYDTKFDNNYIQTKKCGLKTGAYFFCAARTREKIINCTHDMLKHIAGKTFDYPVYIDVESSQAQMNMGRQELTSCLLEALELIKNAGYTAGVYSNENWFNLYIDASAIKEHGYEIWIARYPSISSPVDPTKYDYSDIAGIWQFSDKGTVNGIKTEVDLDVSYKEYTGIIKPSPEIVIGDTNNDGCIDITDLSKLAIALVDKHEFTPEDVLRSDLDGDGSVGLTDLAVLRQYLSKVIESI
jgi:GH25 family lysozyme M1 (1,4-beta-N-acetylmuramidase)